MSDHFGHLVLWKVAESSELSHDTLAEILAGTDVPVPNRPLPIDAFRRLSSAKKAYPLDQGTLEITLATVESKSDKVLSRHLVGTVRNDAGVTQTIRKLGDVAFYKPPRGQHSKARMRIVTHAPYPHQAADFAAHLRSEYERAAKGGALDAQSIRRLVRGYLTQRGAVYLDGPYFTPDPCEALRGIFTTLGGSSFMHTVPLPDTAEQRAFVARFAEEVAA